MPTIWQHPDLSAALYEAAFHTGRSGSIFLFWEGAMKEIRTKTADAITIEPAGSYELKYITLCSANVTGKVKIECFSNSSCTTSVGTLTPFNQSFIPSHWGHYLAHSIILGAGTDKPFPDNTLFIKLSFQLTNALLTNDSLNYYNIRLLKHSCAARSMKNDLPAVDGGFQDTYQWPGGFSATKFQFDKEKNYCYDLTLGSKIIKGHPDYTDAAETTYIEMTSKNVTMKVNGKKGLETNAASGWAKFGEETGTGCKLSTGGVAAVTVEDTEVVIPNVLKINGSFRGGQKVIFQFGQAESKQLNGAYSDLYTQGGHYYNVTYDAGYVMPKNGSIIAVIGAANISLDNSTSIYFWLIKEDANWFTSTYLPNGVGNKTINQTISRGIRTFSAGDRLQARLYASPRSNWLFPSTTIKASSLQIYVVLDN